MITIDIDQIIQRVSELQTSDGELKYPTFIDFVDAAGLGERHWRLIRAEHKRGLSTRLGMKKLAGIAVALELTQGQLRRLVVYRKEPKRLKKPTAQTP